MEFQTADVLLTGADQDISNSFDFSDVANFDFEGEDQLTVGFVASIVDPSNNDLPLGSVTEPIYLQFESQTPVLNEVSIVATQNAAEPNTNGQFTISLSNPSATDTILSYTVSGDATAGDDYAPLSGSVTILANQLDATIDINVLDDTLFEPTESVVVTLDGITAGEPNISIGASNSATVDITDNDPPIPNEVSIVATQNAAEPNTNGQFTISLSNPSATDTILSYTVSGDATAGDDYAPLSGSVTILANQLDATVDINVLDDTLFEPTESVVVTLDGITAGEPNISIGASNSATVDITDNDPPSGGDPVLLFSLNRSTTVDGLSVTDEDIVSFDGSTFTTYFDGSDVGLGSIKIDAFDVISDTEILISFSQSSSIDGIAGTVDDSDIVLFTATSLGANTVGSFSLFFDGSDVGLSNNGEDIDALALLDNGQLLISTVGRFNALGVSGADEDLLAFTPTTFGVDTSGEWGIFFDGSDADLTSGDEDLNAVTLDINGDLLLSTKGNFSVSGVSGADEDILRFIPTTLGEATAGSYDSTLLFDGSNFGLSNRDLFAIDILI